MKREPISRQEVIQVIERKGCSKIPLMLHKWWGEGLEEKYGDALIQIGEKYPEDICVLDYLVPGKDKSPNNNPEYRWGFKESYEGVESHSIGENKVLLEDWSELDEFLEKMPNPFEPGTFDHIDKKALKQDKRYKVGAWWTVFHEALWGIRGMENLMLDYYDHMDELKVLGKALLEYHKGIVDRYSELGVDGIFTSDDLGHQTGPMMSPAVFEELYYPLYKELIEHIHSKGMHMILHSCGDNTLLMPYLIEAGLDVFHPIQIGCMDLLETANKFGDKISFLAGIDVQHLLPEGSVDEVKDGIEEMIKILYKEKGGLLLAAGNGIMPDTPLENIEMMLETVSSYR